MRWELVRWGQAIAVSAAVLTAAAPSAAAAPVSVQPPRNPPMVLPGDRVPANVALAAGSWLVGGRPSAATDRIAERFGAQSLLADAGVYRVAKARARAFADALRAARSLTFAEPNAIKKKTAFPTDPLSGFQYTFDAIRASPLTPPPVTPTSPLLAIIEDDIELGHPEFSGAPISLTRPQTSAGDHGTMVTSVAAAPDNGIGMLGVWPGMNVVVAPAVNGSCDASVQAIGDALARNPAVINMSYGFPGGCYAHRIATSKAFGAGVVLVAAAGNEFEAGNPSDQSPSADPHVITVAALQPDLSAAPFSTAHAGVDVSAPGVSVLAALPFASDVDDGAADGYALVDGTSFAAPIVAAATAWVAALRPGLHHTQLTDLIRYSVRDLGPPGWEPRYGFGIVDLPLALTEPAPSIDRLEPNDNVAWIDGTFFKGADSPISRGKKTVVLRSRLDALEDPADVYRVLVPGKRSLRIGADPLAGATNLRIFSRKAGNVYSSNRRIGQARRKGSKVDRITITNRSKKRRLVYVNVFPDQRASTLDARYKLTVRPVKYAKKGRRVP